MSEKQFNEAWMSEMLNSKDTAKEYSGNLPEIDWVQYKKGYQKDIVFKLMPANSKENHVFSHIVYTHWIEVNGQKKRFVCPEKTAHLKSQGHKCPICEMYRKLRAQGFTDDQLSIQGKFGPELVFEPRVTSNCKVVVLQSDTKNDWDKAHISVLQQNGDYPTIWLAQQYADASTPNFLDITSSNVIRYSRPQGTGKWERSLTFQTFQPTAEIAEKLRDENEALTLPDLWKMPSDQEFLEMRQMMDDLEKNYLEARNAMQGGSSETPVVDDDSIPF